MQKLQTILFIMDLVMSSSQSNFNYSGITTDLLKFNFEGPVHSLSGLVGFEAQGGMMIISLVQEWTSLKD